MQFLFITLSRILIQYFFFIIILFRTNIKFDSSYLDSGVAILRSGISLNAF